MWCFIILTAISPLISALSISISYPDSIKSGERFDVEVMADSDELYDVKVFVHNSDDNSISRGEYVSEIYKDGWRDSWNYLRASYPSQKIYSVKVIDSYGKLNLCARLRKTDTQTTSITCEEIYVEKTVQKESESTTSDWMENLEEIEIFSESRIDTDQLGKLQNLNSGPQERIILNSLDKNSTQKEAIISKKEKSRNLILYSFSFILLVIVVLLALKKM